MNLEKKFLVITEMGFLEKIMSSASVTLVKGKVLSMMFGFYIVLTTR